MRIVEFGDGRYGIPLGQSADGDKVALAEVKAVVVDRSDVSGDVGELPVHGLAAAAAEKDAAKEAAKSTG